LINEEIPVHVFGIPVRAAIGTGIVVFLSIVIKPLSKADIASPQVALV
jgi:hypothetical protein